MINFKCQEHNGLNCRCFGENTIMSDHDKISYWEEKHSTKESKLAAAEAKLEVARKALREIKYGSCKNCGNKIDYCGWRIAHYALKEMEGK